MSNGPSAGLAVDAAVGAIRQDIFWGLVRPGERLDEVTLGAKLEVSRNTLREAFRVLSQQRLVTHEPNRGVFVRTLGRREAREIYAARRVLECGALREAAVLRGAPGAATGGGRSDAQGDPGVAAGRDDDVWRERVEAVRAAHELAVAAAAQGDWARVGWANIDLHLALCRLPGNAVLSELGAHLLNQQRLLFVGRVPAREAYEPYLEVNQRLLELVELGELVRASVHLEDHLLQAEADLFRPLAQKA